MSQVICQAIQARRVIKFQYKGGVRVVEPYMVACNANDHIVLLAWFLRGATKSGEQAGWREYFVSRIEEIELLDESCAPEREGYKSSGGATLHSVVCQVG